MAKLALPALLLVGARAKIRDPITMEEMEELLDKHNLFRCIHDAEPLEWDWDMADEAQEFAENGAFGQLSEQDKYGENSVWSRETTGEQATEIWYSEISKTFNGQTQHFKPESGHYTQIVWKATKKLGCGGTKRSGRDYWVCYYSPAGNIAGDFEEQVPPVEKEERVCRDIVATWEEPQNFTWGFKGHDCDDHGFLTVRPHPDEESDDDLEKFDVLNFGVLSSRDDLPKGSTETGEYTFKPVLGDSKQTRLLINADNGKISFTGQFSTDGGLEVVTTKAGDSFGVKLHANQGRIMGANCKGSMYFRAGALPERKFEASTPLFSATNHYKALAAVCAAGLLIAASALAAVRRRRSGTAAPGLLAANPSHQVDEVVE